MAGPEREGVHAQLALVDMFGAVQVGTQVPVCIDALLLFSSPARIMQLSVIVKREVRD
jgi:hypothetical protein